MFGVECFSCIIPYTSPSNPCEIRPLITLLLQVKMRLEDGRSIAWSGWARMLVQGRQTLESHAGSCFLLLKDNFSSRKFHFITVSVRESNLSLWTEQTSSV